MDTKKGWFGRLFGFDAQTAASVTDQNTTINEPVLSPSTALEKLDPEIVYPITRQEEVRQAFEAFCHDLLSPVENIQNYYASKLSQNGTITGIVHSYWFDGLNLSEKPDIQITNKTTTEGHKKTIEYFINSAGTLISQKDALPLTYDERLAYAQKTYPEISAWENDDDTMKYTEEKDTYKKTIIIGPRGKVIMTRLNNPEEAPIDTAVPTIETSDAQFVFIGELGKKAFEANSTPTEENYQTALHYLQEITKVQSGIADESMKQDLDTMYDAIVAGIMYTVLHSNDDPQKDTKLHALYDKIMTKSRVDRIMAYASLKHIGDAGDAQSFADKITQPEIQEQVKKLLSVDKDNDGAIDDTISLRQQRKELWDQLASDTKTNMQALAQKMQEHYTRGITTA